MPELPEVETTVNAISENLKKTKNKLSKGISDSIKIPLQKILAKRSY